MRNKIYNYKKRVRIYKVRWDDHYVYLYSWHFHYFMNLSLDNKVSQASQEELMIIWIAPNQHLLYFERHLCPLHSDAASKPSRTSRSNPYTLIPINPLLFHVSTDPLLWILNLQLRSSAWIDSLYLHESCPTTPLWFAVSEPLFLFSVTKVQVPASNNSKCLCVIFQSERLFRFNRSFDQLWK